MSARAAASALLLLLLAVPAVHRPAQAGPWLPARGEYSAELRGGLFNSDTYRNDDGDRASLGGRWEERSLGATVEMGWKKKVSLVLGAPLVSATAQEGANSQTSSGLENLLVGVRYGLQQGKRALALEADWRTPLGYSRMHSLLASPVREVALQSDTASYTGTNHATGGLQTVSLSMLYGAPLTRRGFLQLGAGMGRHFLSFGGSDGKHVTDLLIDRVGRPDTLVRGVDQAKEAWANELTFSADLGLWFGRSLLIGGRYAGVMTMSHGEDYPDRTEHLAGPVVVYRVDDRLDLSAGSWSTALGKNVLHRDLFYVALTFKQTHLDRLQGFLGGTKNP
jgi:hypothetical protein